MAVAVRGDFEFDRLDNSVALLEASRVAQAFGSGRVDWFSCFDCTNLIESG